ncbi:alpha-L-fucosidase [Streptomyces sp. NBC_01775]|uniref:alpha-L-fucosidase n=1 Tax=Streptomyces sp. NBC_01775 TaxID=2975939 RepID=UPI002DDA7B93|nr:alpha-L-fucosidase [Streptomyces sp. NBC_01775]WSB74802.1 alpha-L-fucosidase [Streptomyces sp. NBC_01775]
MHRASRNRLRTVGVLLGAGLLAASLPSGSGAAEPSPSAGAKRPLSGPGTNYAVDDAFTSDRTEAWRQDRFGMFIHFGAYSNLEGEYTRPDGTVCQDAEWIMRQCDIPKKEYEKQAATFDPAGFDARKVVKAAKDAGQRYFVITSKHHDGYAMWPTRANNWNLRDHSSFDKRRDILRELKTEADRAGIKLGFYYSIWDWHDPDFADPATFPQYKKRMYAQLKELVDDYDPALLWFDGEWDADNPVNRWSPKDGAELETYVKGLKPSLLVNNRVGKRRVSDGDFGTPEQEIPDGPVDGQPWESCMTLNGHWGYARYDHEWKSPAELIRNLLSTAGRSGNYLLNVGPDSKGRIPHESVSRLRAVGDWLRSNGQGRAVYGAGYSGLVEKPEWGEISREGSVSREGPKKLHAAVTDWPEDGKPLHLKARTPFEIRGARVLGSDQKVKVTPSGDGFDITPSGAPVNDTATVIELSVTSPAPRHGSGGGLKARIWDNDAFAGRPAVTRTDPSVNYAWRFDGSPAPSVPAGRFSTRWTGSLQPRYTDTYSFTTVSDDTAKVWIDGKLVIDSGEPHDPRVDKGTIALKAGQKYAIKVEHRQQGGEAHMKLLWSSPNQQQEIVPRSQLYKD